MMYYVRLRTSLSNLGGDGDAYLANHEARVTKAVGRQAVMRIDPGTGEGAVVEVRFEVQDDEIGADVTKEAMHRAAEEGFITERITIPAPLFQWST